MTRGSFLNAIVALAAIGGSTNAVVHLLAIAGRLGIELSLDDFDRTGAGVPLLVDLQPAGRHLMEDFHRAGGLLAVLREVRDLLDPDALTVTGTAAGRLPGRRADLGRDGHPPRATTPLQTDAGIAVLRGNLAPGRRGHQAGRGVAGAAAAPRPGGRLRQHRGHARPHRRPRPRRRRRLGARAARLRPEGLPRHAGGGEHAAAGQAAGAGRARHGADLRRADERHRVRHGRPARGARGGGRRAAGAGRDRRPDHPRRRRPAPRRSTSRRRSWRRASRSAAMHGGLRRARAGAGSASTSTTCMQADPGADLDFLVGSSGHRVSRESH